MTWKEVKNLNDTQAELCLFCRVSKVFEGKEAWITCAFDQRQEDQGLRTAVMSYIDLLGATQLAAEKPMTKKVRLRLLEKMLGDQEEQELKDDSDKPSH